MNTFWKITLGFMIGVVCTLATLIVFGAGYSDNAGHKPTEHKNRVLQFQSDEEAPEHNVHSFELSTKNGIIKILFRFLWDVLNLQIYRILVEWVFMKHGSIKDEISMLTNLL